LLLLSHLQTEYGNEQESVQPDITPNERTFTAASAAVLSTPPASTLAAVRQQQQHHHHQQTGLTAGRTQAGKGTFRATEGPAAPAAAQQWSSAGRFTCGARANWVNSTRLLAYPARPSRQLLPKALCGRAGKQGGPRHRSPSQSHSRTPAALPYLLCFIDCCCCRHRACAHEAGGGSASKELQHTTPQPAAAGAAAAAGLLRAADVHSRACAPCARRGKCPEAGAGGCAAQGHGQLAVRPLEEAQCHRGTIGVTHNDG